MKAKVETKKHIDGREYAVFFRHYRVQGPTGEFLRRTRKGSSGRTGGIMYHKGLWYDDSLKVWYETDIKPYACGGMTECDLVDPESGTVIVTGYAHCSILDTFNKRIGRDISLGRAIKSLKLAGHERA